MVFPKLGWTDKQLNLAVASIRLEHANLTLHELSIHIGENYRKSQTDVYYALKASNIHADDDTLSANNKIKYGVS